MKTIVKTYGCCKCQTRHTMYDPLFEKHWHHQSKHGIALDLTEVRYMARNGNSNYWYEVTSKTYFEMRALQEEASQGRRPEIHFTLAITH